MQVICCSQSNTSKRHGGYINIGTLRGETYFQCIFLPECILGIIYVIKSFQLYGHYRNTLNIQYILYGQNFLINVDLQLT